MSRVDISGLGTVPETMLITVRARAIETDKSDGIIRDPYAKKILDSIGNQDKKKQKISGGSQVGVCIRTEYLDNVVKDFLKKSPDGTVVNLGCGLDARYERLNNSKVRWFDIDLPESIEVRRAFFEDHDNYKMLGVSALDFVWIKEIPTNKPVLILSEGVLMYFEPSDVERLISVLAEAFPGALMAFDAISPWMVKNSNVHPDVKRYDAVFRWGIDSEKDVAAMAPGIEIMDTTHMMELYSGKWPFFMRFFKYIPKLRTSSKMITMRFGK